MSNNTGFFNCKNTCWIIGALMGFAALLLAQGRLGMAFILALIVGLIVMFGVAWFLKKTFCTDESQPSTASGVTTGSTAAAASGSATAASLASTDATATTSSAAARSTDTVAAPVADIPAAPVPEAEPTPAAAKPASEVKKPAAKKPAAKKPAAKKATAKTAEAKKPAAKKAPAKKAATKPAKAAAVASEPAAPTGKPKKPRTMKAPRKAGADDLKQLKGVGPKLEQTLNGLGFWHFDQIAKWGADEISWVDDNLSFKGRIERDGWVEQAKTLAEGGETAFSKKVKKGDVY